MSDVYNVGFPSELVREGQVEVVVPNLSAYGVVVSDYAPSRAPVFYNPIMEFNRDLSVLALRAYQRLVNHKLSICEPLTSQGIRGIRYAVEVKDVSNVLLSDINFHAYELAQHNILRNNLQDVITLMHGEANSVLSANASPKRRFDIIDIDPFGSPVPYLDSAFRALKDNGLMAVTATDLAPLCGVHAKACVRKYGGKPMRVEYCHELAVRLLAGCMAYVAAKHDIGINVLFSHSSDHYIRVYVQIHYGCQRADASLKNMGYILHCFNCLHRAPSHQPFVSLVCPMCGGKLDYAGPLWLDCINDEAYISQMLMENQSATFKTHCRISKLLSSLKAEAAAPITYYVLDLVGKKLRLPATSMQAFIVALQAKGYKVVPSHFNPRSIKTNASTVIIQETFRELVEQV